MKIVDKGWAVWRELRNIHATIYPTKKSAIEWFLYGSGYTSWNHAYRAGYRVLRTTATATVAKKKARKK